MQTSFAEVESIFVTKDGVTVAASIMLKGFNYSEPAYTNIFCSAEQLTELLLCESSSISSQVLLQIANNIDKSEQLEIHLHDLNDNRPWKLRTKMILEPVESATYGFTCYDLVGPMN